MNTANNACNLDHLFLPTCSFWNLATACCCISGGVPGAITRSGCACMACALNAALIVSVVTSPACVHNVYVICTRCIITSSLLTAIFQLQVYSADARGSTTNKMQQLGEQGAATPHCQHKHNTPSDHISHSSTTHLLRCPLGDSSPRSPCVSACEHPPSGQTRWDLCVRMQGHALSSAVLAVAPCLMRGLGGPCVV